METGNNSKGSGGNSSKGGRGVTVDLGALWLASAAVLIAFMIFLAFVYSLVFGFFGLALYLGVRLGSQDKVDFQFRKPEYKKVHQLGAAQQKHLVELQDESDELRKLVVRKFDEDKLDLYRPQEQDRKTIINVAPVVEKVATMAKNFMR